MANHTEVVFDIEYRDTNAGVISKDKAIALRTSYGSAWDVSEKDTESYEKIMAKLKVLYEERWRELFSLNEIQVESIVLRAKYVRFNMSMGDDDKSQAVVEIRAKDLAIHNMNNAAPKILTKADKCLDFLSFRGHTILELEEGIENCIAKQEKWRKGCQISLSEIVKAWTERLVTEFNLSKEEASEYIQTGGCDSLWHHEYKVVKYKRITESTFEEYVKDYFVDADYSWTHSSNSDLSFNYVNWTEEDRDDELYRSMAIMNAQIRRVVSIRRL